MADHHAPRYGTSKQRRCSAPRFLRQTSRHPPPIHAAAKATELRKEIEILSQSFERVLDRKESVMQSCLRDLSEAESQVRERQATPRETPWPCPAGLASLN